MGLRGQDPLTKRQELYFIGIIDCLTLYVFKKKMANVVKRAIWEKAALSTVNANYYAERFHHYSTKRIIHYPEDNVERRGRSNSSGSKADLHLQLPAQNNRKRRKSAPRKIRNNDSPVKE